MTALSKVWETVHDPFGTLTQHRHDGSYLTLVIAGVYEERSVDGRFECQTGDVIFHPPFHMHGNAFGSMPVRTLNIKVTDDDLPNCYSVYRYDTDCRFRASAALETIVECLRNRHASEPKNPIRDVSWLEEFASRLRNMQDRRTIAQLAKEVCISPEHISRRFKLHYGVGPSAYRGEMRLRSALDMLGRGIAPASAAHQAGYSDQSHMTRSMKSSLGRTPAALHRKINSVQYE